MAMIGGYIGEHSATFGPVHLLSLHYRSILNIIEKIKGSGLIVNCRRKILYVFLDYFI